MGRLSYHALFCSKQNSLNTNTVTKWWKTKNFSMRLCCFLFTVNMLCVWIIEIRHFTLIKKTTLGLHYTECQAIFYMYICRILLIQLLGCHIEINACLVSWQHNTHTPQNNNYVDFHFLWCVVALCKRWHLCGTIVWCRTVLSKFITAVSKKTRFSSRCPWSERTDVGLAEDGNFTLKDRFFSRGY